MTEILSAAGFCVGVGLGWWLFAPEMARGAARLAHQVRALLQMRIRGGAASRQWADLLTLMAAALRSGASLSMAVDLALAEGPDPLRAILAGRAARAPGPKHGPAWFESVFSESDLAFVRSALLLGRVWGAREAALLERASARLRKKDEQTDRFRALTAQARLSAWIVGGTPPALIVLMRWVSPDLFAPFLASGLGQALLAIAGILLIAGIVVVARMSRLEP